MKRKIIKILPILLIMIIFVTGCENKNVGSNETTSATSNMREALKMSTNQTVHEHCTRGGNAGEGIEVSLTYELYSKGDILTKLESNEMVTTTNQNVLDEYEKAYKNIHANYKGLNYYNATTKRTTDSVASKIIIEYDKINIDKLLEIEGEEDNVFEDGLPKVTKWKELAKKFGTKCEVVE